MDFRERIISVLNLQTDTNLVDEIENVCNDLRHSREEAKIATIKLDKLSSGFEEEKMFL